MKMNKEVVMVRISDIIPNRFQPRLTFDEEALNELSNSIKEHGIIQPLILRDLGSKYEIIAGERRYKAATLAGLSEVPAIIGSMDDQTSAELALIENIQRKDLSAIEEAKSYKKILDMGNFTQEELAKRMGKSQSTIANKMRLLSLTNEVQVALMNNLISERHARCLLQIKDEDLQKQVLNKIITERINVRDTDEYIKNLLGISKETPKVEEHTNNEIDLTKPIDNNINPLYSPIESENKEEKNENPNVYTQTKNIDFVNINNLNNDKNVPTEIEVPAPVAEPSKPEERKIEPMTNTEVVKETPNKMEKIKYATAIRLAKDTVEDIKTLGYNAAMEEFDTPNDYQIIIKIQK
ncbi:MAG: ParB/RepB/Spo0J family partition protein [Bacilli bacterium]